jgi:endonuclease/exonuclease/phosphatase family metal-dependent hydrolase
VIRERRLAGLVGVVVFVVACGGGGSAETVGQRSAGDKTDGGVAPSFRLMAANVSSGQASKYNEGEGIRLFRGLRPDIAFVQELNYKTNSKADLDEFVALAFGAEFTLVRETGLQIPNAVVSRFPVLSSGQWADPQVANRGFSWAKIAVPSGRGGSHALWAVAVHLLTTSPANRDAEAKSLLGTLKGVMADGDYVAIAGDFNTGTRSEPCIQTLAPLVDTTASYPVDQQGNTATNGPRNKPHDWVLVSPALGAHQVPTVIGANAFPTGLVFDSRIYSPIADVAPIEAGDSAAVNMQHMPVLRDFVLPE